MIRIGSSMAGCRGVCGLRASVPGVLRNVRSDVGQDRAEGGGVGEDSFPGPKQLQIVDDREFLEDVDPVDGDVAHEGILHELDRFVNRGERKRDDGRVADTEPYGTELVPDLGKGRSVKGRPDDREEGDESVHGLRGSVELAFPQVFRRFQKHPFALSDTGCLARAEPVFLHTLREQSELGSVIGHSGFE